MRAMAKKYTTDKEENFFVMGYASRPAEHVKPKGTDQRPMWLSL
jgi:hypothetical protein